MEMVVFGRSMLVLSLVAWCGACGVQSRIGTEDAGQLQVEPSGALCDAVANAGVDKDKLLRELVVRNAVSSDHVPLIKDGQVVIGMNACETEAAWGLPQNYVSDPAVDRLDGRKLEMVYDYGLRGRVDFGHDGLVTDIIKN